MAILYENYTTSSSGGYSFGIDLWSAQTFTPVISHYVTKVKMNIYRSGSPGTITVSIRATSSGVPTGGDLCVGTIDGDAINTSPAQWHEITFNTSTLLSASAMYAMVARCVAEDTYWRAQATSPYAGGTRTYSTNAGVDWTAPATQDFNFEEWGVIHSPLPSFRPEVS